MTVEIRRAPYAAWRALAATVLVMTGAVGAHTTAGGHVPDGAALVALGALVLGGSLLVMHGLVAGRWLLPVVALAQAGLHAAFSSVPSAGEHVHAGHDVWTWQMLLAHGGVTLLTAAIWWLAARAATGVLGALPPLHHRVVVEPPRRPTDAHSPRALARRAHSSVAPRRGPPVLPRPA
ncbi:hypothetical protein GCM10009623_10160 [Nocardioides aestuarii]|uniref:MFS transporter n=1 Tax=Nocardioides aestuarii TaxID=252231 RepID=A0ABW4THP4_9ACTN